ncbi:MAG: T9SS type A sorting domain-containing protein, partial [Saprospiraceae bacterium]|nr:T9SS type A sorting domain-containing protein [Saprospiraceae bacterium]
TASETNNAGFEVQIQDGENWTVLGFVDGHGTTTEAQTYSYTAEGVGVGTHVFRLKQIDYDGQFEYHGNVEVTVETPGTHVLSNAYPNPFNPQSQFTLAVAQDQLVTAELYNALGQRVATLFNGTVEADQSQLVTIDGAGLASGTYIVRVTGESFADALRVTLLK